jgi:hypothetical protein
MLFAKGDGMGTFKGIIAATAIAVLGVVGAGCDDDDDAVAVDEAEFDAIDTNRDGLVSTSEWAATFGTWDVNNDGLIGANEYLLDDGFSTLDGDGNGTLTNAEWNAAMVDWDLDGDGFLDEDEMFF